MPSDTTPAPMTSEAAAHKALVASMRDTHALEKQQIQVLEAHLDLFQDYPDLHARFTEHIVSTRDQARRLEAGLEACGDSASMVKDAMMSAMGLGQSSIQSFGDQAQLKAVTADLMQEHLEIATYRVLLVLADEAGKPDLRHRLEETLQEEEAMASWFEDNLEAIPRRFVELKATEDRQVTVAKERVKQAENDASPTADSQMSGTLWQQLETANRPGIDPTSTARKSRDKDAPAATIQRSDTMRPTPTDVPASAAAASLRPDRT